MPTTRLHPYKARCLTAPYIELMNVALLLLAGLLAPLEADTADLYLQLPKAHAALNAGRFAEAKPIYEAFAKANPYMGSQVRNLALCEFKLGEFESAAKHYQQASETFWNKWECLFGVANSYAMLKDKARTVSALKVAKAAGWPDYMTAVHSADFAFLESDSEYRKVVGLPPQGKFTREQQWHHDLDFLLEEALRRHFSPPDRGMLATEISKIKSRAGTLSDEQIGIEVSRFMALMGDGHTLLSGGEMSERHGIQMPSPLDNDVWQIRLAWFPDGYYVVEAAEALKGLLGKKLQSVDGKPMTEVVARLEPLISKDNEEWVKVMVPTKFLPAVLHGVGISKDRKSCELGFSDGAKATLTSVARSGASLTHFQAQGDPALYRKNPEKLYWFERVPEKGLLYVRYRGCVDQENDPIAGFWGRVLEELDKNPGDKLVVDMRGNTGGSGQVVEPLIKGLQQRPRLSAPGMMFAITDRLTYSAALYACGKLEGLGAMFVGGPTGGRPNFVGEYVPFVLPFSKWLVSVSNRYHQNSFMSDQRPYFPPRLVAELSFEDWASNRDPAMDAIDSYSAATKGAGPGDD